MSKYILAAIVFATLPAYAQTASSVEQLVEQGRRLGADSTLLLLLPQRAAEAGLDEETTAALVEPAVLLADLNLPARKVMLKALEGLAKRVPPEQIATVLSQLRLHTIQAGSIVDRWLRKPEAQRLLQFSMSTPHSMARDQVIESLARATVHGMPEPELQDFLTRLAHEVKRDHVSGKEIAAAIQVLQDLIDLSVQHDAGADFIILALNTGFTDADLRQLPSTLREVQHYSDHSASELLTDVSKRLAEGVPPAKALNAVVKEYGPEN